MFVTVLQRLLGGDASPNKVVEIKTDTFGNQQVLIRDENLILYGPAGAASGPDRKSLYEIVFHRPNEQGNIYGFSLYRAQTQVEAEDKFNALFQRLPTFIGIVPKMCNVNGLQQICDVLIGNPSWTLTHVVAHFNLTEHIIHPKIIENIDFADHATFMTPLQVFINIF